MSGCSKASSSAGSASLISRGNEYWTGHEEEEEEVSKKEEEDTARVNAGGKHLGQTVGQKISGILCQLGLLTLVLGLLNLHSCGGTLFSTALHCVFSNVSSNCLPDKRHV